MTNLEVCRQSIFGHDLTCFHLLTALHKLGFAVVPRRAECLERRRIGRGGSRLTALTGDGAHGGVRRGEVSHHLLAFALLREREQSDE